MNEKTTKEKSGFWSVVISFLSVGGFLVILIVVVVIAIVISTLMN